MLEDSIGKKKTRYYRNNTENIEIKILVLSIISLSSWDI